MVDIHVTHENINKEANIDSKDEELLDSDDDTAETESSEEESADKHTAESRRELENHLEEKRLKEELDDYKLDNDDEAPEAQD